MSNNWQSQEALHSRDWHSRTYLATDYQGQLPTEYAALNTALDETSCVFKHDQTTTVAKFELTDQSLVLKRYNPRSGWHKLKRALRQSRAHRCWKMSYAFNQAGLNVARPVLMHEHRFGPLCFDAYFVTQMLEGQELLQVLPTMASPERLKVLSQIKEAFAKMRNAKLTHGDMKASNLLWANGKIFFIDLDAAAAHQSAVTWNASHAKDRKRFLKNWQQQPDLIELFSGL